MPIAGLECDAAHWEVALAGGFRGLLFGLIGA
jgi:hypothetical protein